VYGCDSHGVWIRRSDVARPHSRRRLPRQPYFDAGPEIVVHAGRNARVFWSTLLDFLLPAPLARASASVLKCPLCHAFMKSVRRGTAAADVCSRHGIWFDGKAFMKYQASFSKRMQRVSKEIRRRNEENEARRRSQNWS